MPSFTPFSSDADIETIATGLLTRTLPKSAWTHAAHFAATIWLLRHRPDFDLPRDLPAIIRSYNEASGGRNTDTEGHHETITQASITAARMFLEARAKETLFETCNALMASELGDPDWILRHWTRATLFSTKARVVWVPPDIRPLSDGFF